MNIIYLSLNMKFNKLIIFVTLCLSIICISQIKIAKARPEDAERLRPLAEFTKNAFGSLLLGEQMKFDDSLYSIARGLGSLMWKSGAIFQMPKTTIQKLQDYYDKIYERVMSSDVSQVSRMTFVGLKNYIDEIIDSIMDEVEMSAKNSFDYARVKVGTTDESLEQALHNIGMQIRAYAVDVRNYRDLAKMVLGVPVVPTLASGIVDVAKLPTGLLNRAGVDMSTIRDLPSNSINRVSQYGQSAVNTMLNPIDALGNGINRVNNLVPRLPKQIQQP